MYPTGAYENHRRPLLWFRRIFLASQSFVADPENYSLDREQKEFLKNETFYGNEIVSSTYKTALMNLYLHNIGDITAMYRLPLVMHFSQTPATVWTMC